jgi:DNA-binding response OmpR family regulator
MDADVAGKRVLVLSDNERLSRVIELALRHAHLEVVGFVLSFTRQWKSQAEAGFFDLIVVAVSSPTGEPVVALVMDSLAGRVGQLPILIISDDPSQSDPDNQIFYLDFPFEIHGLYDKVEEILQGRMRN